MLLLLAARSGKPALWAPSAVPAASGNGWPADGDTQGHRQGKGYAELAGEHLEEQILFVCSLHRAAKQGRAGAREPSC